MFQCGVGRVRFQPTLSQVLLGALLAVTLSFASLPASAQTPTTPLHFGNNYFVTGDYVVAGVGLRGLGKHDVATGLDLATGTINLPDAYTVPSTGVPTGAQVVAAFLYWETVESTGGPTGQNGFFRPLYSKGPARYPISGVILGNPHAPVSWSNGGCSGAATGSKTIRAYRADVRPLLRQDANGNILANQAYEVTLADSGSKGGNTPFTLGASLVIIYRVISPDFPLKSIVIYDDAFAPSNGNTTMTQPLSGFYQAAANPVSKLTHIVGNGQPNKAETVSLDNVALKSVYGASSPAFVGIYNGSWDNPTWALSGAGNPMHENDASATTQVVPSGSSGNCVTWGAVILSTTVKDTDKDGLLDTWEDNGGYTDALDGTFVPLPGACSGGPGQPPACFARNGKTQDVFLQVDYLCTGDTTTNACTPGGHTHYLDPNGPVLTNLENVFANRGITVHPIVTNSIAEATCADTSTLRCAYPGQPGTIGWKVGFEFLKNQPINTDPSTGTTWTEAACEAAQPGQCIRRFQHGKKDSYHYVVIGHSLGRANWSFADGSLLSISVSNTGLATLTVNAPTGLAPDPLAGTGRVTIANVVSAPALNGTFLVTSANNAAAPYTFTVQTTNVPAGSYTAVANPNVAVGSGQAGTGSGISDRGGADSLITLGSWGAFGTGVPVIEGTIMHEMGHTFGLTHGGYYYNGTPKIDYTPTVEANCKPNYLSIMNYLYQVDLLDGKFIDYSGQSLTPVGEQNGYTGALTDVPTGNAATYSTTSWFTNDASGFVGHPSQAKHHCDGSPILDNSKAFLVQSPTNSVAFPGIDLNFDGTVPENFNGYDDWDNLDLRQIGATGSDLIGAGINGGWGGINGGWGGINGGWGGINGGWGGINGGWGGINGGWGGINGGWGGTGLSDTELDVPTATASVRPPTALIGTPHDTRTSHSVALSWTVPTGVQTPIQYNIYRSSAQPPSYPTTPTYTSTGASFTDSNVADCTTYTYVVTALFTDTTDPTKTDESVQTNAFSDSVPCTASNLSATRTAAGVTLTWTAAGTPPGAPASYMINGYNLYRDNGTMPIATPAASPYFDPITDTVPHTYYLTAVVSDQQGCAAGQYCRESTQISFFVKGLSSTTITSTSPNPSTIGQAITVSFSITPLSETGSVTVSDGQGATCTGVLNAGLGSCSLTPTEFVNGNPAVGPVALTATYGGDANYFGSTSAPYTQQVRYSFVGFLPPLTLNSFSGTFTLGTPVPVKWQLQDASGNSISQLSSLQILTVIFNPPTASCSASLSGTPLTLYTPGSGVTGNSTFSYDATHQQFVFNWDTTSVSTAPFAPGCYTVLLGLNDGSPARLASLGLAAPRN